MFLLSEIIYIIDFKNKDLKRYVVVILGSLRNWVCLCVGLVFGRVGMIDLEFDSL